MLKTIDPVGSMMNFNTRVLHTAKQHVCSDVKELQKALFFASVYQSNCDELFGRDTEVNWSLVATYRKNGSTYVSTMRDIILEMRKQNLMITQEIDPAILLQLYPMLRKVPHSIPIYFQQDCIYYATIRKGEPCIRVLSPNDQVYQTILRRGDTIYKTDRAILSFFQVLDDSNVGLVFRVVPEQNASNVIHKVEYWGHPPMLALLLNKYFRHVECVTMNPFLYIGDLQLIVDSVVPKEEEVIEPPTLRMADIFQKDQLVEYPRQSFGNYIDLLKEAASSPVTTAINITLYRIGDSPVLLDVLEEAVERGIEVNVHLECYATGEDINGLWLSLLEDIGVNVYCYHPGTIKVHAKLTLIQCLDGYMLAQIGTGNYHSKTTLQYTDLMLFTADKEICKEVYRVFEMLMDTEPKTYRTIYEFTHPKFLVSRNNARDQLIHLIDQEAAKGEDGMILFKMNALDDPEIIEHLAVAEEEGCQICLMVRGMCTWLPSHLDDNVEIRSMIWDKLEHSRVYSFGRSDPIIYLGSMDLVEHKMDHRIETLCRVDDPDLVLWLTQYLNRYATATDHVWTMQANGAYQLKEDTHV